MTFSSPSERVPVFPKWENTMTHLWCLPGGQRAAGTLRADSEHWVQHSRGPQRAHDNDAVTRYPPSLQNRKAHIPNCYYFMALFPHPKLSTWSRNPESWSQPSPCPQVSPLQFILGGRLVEGYILLGPVRPLRSGGSGPAGRWPGRSAGPAAGAVVSHQWVAACSSCSLRRNRWCSASAWRTSQACTPLSAFSAQSPNSLRGKEILHSKTQVNMPQWRAQHSANSLVLSVRQKDFWPVEKRNLKNYYSPTQMILI